jgi:nucleotide-binding universal stress UspA family protein
MTTVIVPLDFSETSFNAAHYAAAMFADKPATTIVLYHYYASVNEVTTATQFMTSLAGQLSATGLKVETELETGDNFIERLSAFAHVKRAYMIVMGLTGKTPMAQRFSGSNTLKMAEKNVCPVLIVPERASYKGINNVLIASEMKYVDESPVLIALKTILKDFKPSLHILNVDSSHYISLTENFKTERDKMATLLDEFNPEFYFMRLFDFHESINLFTRDKNIDMIIIGPKHHSFFERLFKTQHTKAVVYQSEVPVLAIHE